MENLLKISSLNCMNLKNNYEDLVKDPTLMQSSIIALSETWLQPNDILTIDGFKTHTNSIGQGKGLAVYFKDDTFKPIIDIKEEKLQITKIGSKDIEIVAIYRSEQGSTLQLIQHLNNIIKPEIATVICGDFNICYRATRNNRVTKFLEQLGFLQLMKEATHIRGRIIDHFYFRGGVKIQDNPKVHRYSPYYSDHDAICVTLNMTFHKPS